ncbi:O-antigen ligase family protein [Metasolibacillus meyeri]|uniref:O-antigen ligase family protein n=1 Tax=Metasolibacillus meyeri TaxID=1071052 RepID=UPI000D3267C4|nr:O-antigen ligase family protein [Metasolibacillus meyeri]
MASFYEELQKTNVVSDEKENAQSRANVDKWIFRLLLLVIGFMPLIVMANVEEVISPLISNVDVLSSGIKGELFTHYKALLLVVITVIASVLLLSKIFFMGGTIRKTKLNYVLGVFAGAIIVSTMASPTITVALNGLYNRSDGAISWLCYVALLFIAMNIEYPKKAVKYVTYAFAPLAVINFIIIVLNFTGKDLLQREWAGKLVSLFLPSGANISEGSQLLGTLNHGNYMSGMFAIVAALFLVNSLVDDKMFDKVFSFIMAALSILIVLMSLSTSGFLTIVVMLPFILWVAFKNDKKVVALVQVIAFCVIAVAGVHVLAKENAKVWDESIGFFISNNPYKEEAMSLNSELFSLSNRVYAADAQFELPSPAGTGVGAGSGRVYIWSYMMDLVKDRPLLGYGLDTLMYEFPHYNEDARANLETEAVIVDKPHNMYLGVLYGTGIIGFVFFLALITFVTVKSLKVVLNGKTVTTVLAVATLAFLCQAVFNDTLPGIAAPIMVLMGMLMVNTKAPNNKII